MPKHSRMQWCQWAALLSGCLIGQWAIADTPRANQSQQPTTLQINHYVPNAEIVGQGRLRYMLWSVYDAALYAPNGEWQSTEPYALVIDYLREVAGETLAQATYDEMIRLNCVSETAHQQLHETLFDLFPDVDDNTQLIGIRTQSGETVLYSNDKSLGQLTDPTWTDCFFAIWLSEATAEPQLRQQLLNK